MYTFSRWVDNFHRRVHLARQYTVCTPAIKLQQPFDDRRIFRQFVKTLKFIMFGLNWTLRIFALLISQFIGYIRSFLCSTFGSQIKFRVCVEHWLKLLVCVLRHIIYLLAEIITMIWTIYFFNFHYISYRTLGARFKLCRFFV